MRQEDMARDQEQQEAQQGQEQLPCIPVPGKRLDPTDKELAIWYLINKNLGNPHPHRGTRTTRRMEASEFYSQHPEYLGGGPFDVTERQWLFLVHGVERSRVQVVGNIGVGFWRSLGVEESIYDYTNEDVVALKIQFTYYSGAPACAKRTHWRMDAYVVPHRYAEMSPWALAKVIRGRDYGGVFENYCRFLYGLSFIRSY